MWALPRPAVPETPSSTGTAGSLTASVSGSKRAANSVSCRRKTRKPGGTKRPKVPPLISVLRLPSAIVKAWISASS